MLSHPSTHAFYTMVQKDPLLVDGTPWYHLCEASFASMKNAKDTGPWRPTFQLMEGLGQCAVSGVLESHLEGNERL